MLCFVFDIDEFAINKQGLQSWESDKLPIFSDSGLVLENIVGVSAKSALSERTALHLKWFIFLEIAVVNSIRNGLTNIAILTFCIEQSRNTQLIIGDVKSIIEIVNMMGRL